MSLLELHWILQCLCVRQEDGGGGPGGLFLNLPQPQVNKTKQHTTLAALFVRSQPSFLREIITQYLLTRSYVKA